MATVPRRNILAAAVLAGLGASACRDALSPPAAEPVRPPSFETATDQEVRITGRGHLGSGDTIPGSDRKEFDFDVSSTLTGRVFYRDWGFVNPDGSVGTLIVDASTDSSTAIRRVRDGSDACADFTHGAEFDGTGRLSTGELVGFTVYACDNGAAGSGSDFFRIDVFAYRREGTATSGDVVKTGGGTPRASGVRVTGLGQLGAGLPLPGNEVATFEFEAAADLTGAKFYQDWIVIRKDGTVGNLRVDPLDPGTRITAFRDGSDACPDFTRGVEFDGVGRVNAQGEVEGDRSVLWPFTVRVCDNGPDGADWYNLVAWEQDFTPHYDMRGFLTAGDILKSRDLIQTLGL
jgi:hypothetical protein